MPIHRQTIAGRFRRKWELAASRSLAAVAAAVLVAATAQALRPGPWHASHPRNWVIAVACCLLAVRIIAHARRNAVGWLLLAMGLCAAVTVGCDAVPGVRVAAWVATWSWWPTYALPAVVALVFPTGTLPSRRWWWRCVLACGAAATLLGPVGIGWAAWSAPGSFWDDAVRGTAQRGWPLVVALVGLGALLLGLLGGVAAQVVRWRRAEGGQRRLLVWAAAGTVLMTLAILFELSGAEWAAWAVGAAALPAATLVAVMRYGLYEIDLVIHRSLLYGLLVAILLAVQAVAVMLATRPFPAAADALGTVAVVVTLAPLYRLLRERLGRWLYGDRDNPYAALSRLARSLAHPLPAAEVFPAVARSVAEALKLPYVAVLLDAEPQARPLARYGHSHDRPPLRVPMTYGGTRVGELVVEPRSPDERLGRREQRLLADLATQVAPTARSERLDRDLRRVRARLAHAREEERREIRRDLHDGIRSGLAGIGLQLDSARQHVRDGQPVLDDLLGRARHNLTSTLCAIDQVVAGRLQPADLEHGLVEALRRRPTADARDAGVSVELTTEGDLGRLPEAVEAAAYWVASEALTNVVRHSRADSCHIRLSRTSALDLEIVDDGIGLPDVRPAHDGGLLLMAERCTELGGEFTIARIGLRGTRVNARFPLDSEDNHLS